MHYGIVFDCDGVLANTEEAICRATTAMFKELYGVEMKPEDFTPFIGTGPIRYTEGPAEKYGLKIDIDKAVAKREANFVQLVKDGMDISFPGVPELVETLLSDDTWKLAIATSSSLHKSQQSMTAARIPYDRFDAYVTGDLVEHKKPAPDIYLKAAEELGLPPEHCVGIEDAVSGVQAVKAAGMKCLAVTGSFSRDDLSDADHIVDSLKEVSVRTFRELLGLE